MALFLLIYRACATKTGSCYSEATKKKQLMYKKLDEGRQSYILKNHGTQFLSSLFTSFNPFFYFEVDYL